MHRALAAPLAVLATGAVGVGYAAGYEVRAFRLRRVRVPVLAPGQPPLRVLHVSDLHLVPAQTKKRTWVAALAALEPHLVVCTGDNLAHRDAVPAVLETYGGLLERPGVFVMGSNDYFGPKPKNPASYLLRSSASDPRRAPSRLPTQDLVDGFLAAGWVDLDNARGSIVADGRSISLAGVDDPHLRLDRYPLGHFDATSDLTLGVTHAPYRRVLDAMTQDGAGLVLAGHTHGGQLCVPGFGALVTNCDLPRSYAKGLSRWVEPGGRTTWLHVSAGLGTSPFAPVRFACPPEATLLTLVASKRV